MNEPSRAHAVAGFFRPQAALLTTDREEYRFFVVTHFIYLFSLVGHALFIVLFAVLSVPVLAIYNVVSVVLFTACIAINKRGRHGTAFLLGATEVVVHSALCAILIGWDTGFHYFVIAIVPFTMLLPFLHVVRKMVIALIFLCLYGGVYIFAHAVHPPYQLSPLTTMVLNYANLVITFGAFSFLIHYLTQASLSAEKAVGELSRTDYLTGITNRRGMISQLESEYTTFRRTGRPFSVLVVDLDRFKRINDRYGHAAGDAILVATARAFQDTLRSRDQLCRWGGEEFLVMLPETNLDGASIVSQKLLERMRALRVPFGSRELAVTITIGGACCDRRASVDQLIVCADRALYAGKDGGRDRAVMCRDIGRCGEGDPCHETPSPEQNSQ